MSYAVNWAWKHIRNRRIAWGIFYLGCMWTHWPGSLHAAVRSPLTTHCMGGGVGPRGGSERNGLEKSILTWHCEVRVSFCNIQRDSFGTWPKKMRISQRLFIRFWTCMYDYIPCFMKSMSVLVCRSLTFWRHRDNDWRLAPCRAKPCHCVVQ